ncbi:MAG: 2-phospho-L-lactate transferase CofD family protein, partial [Solimonas sp.]
MNLQNNSADYQAKRYLALSGGVGGARLAHGLAQVLPPGALTVAVNTGDDFEPFGLPVWPDFDTVLYTLAGVAHRGQGWGRADETFSVMDELRRLGGEDWFLLGDRDIALHLVRRALLAQGLRAGEVAAELCRRLDVRVPLLPVSDDALRTQVETDEGTLPFQHYFVRRRCEPALRALRFEGAERARLG